MKFPKIEFSHRFFLYAPVAAIVGLALAVSVYWFAVAHTFSKRLDALNGHQVAPGISFHYASKSIGGFPFRVDAVLKNMRVTVATRHGPAVWKTEHFALHMLDYGRLQLVFEAAGKQVLIWHDTEGTEQAIDFVPALLRASAIVSGREVSRFDIELYGGETPSFTVAHTEFHMRRAPDANALDFALMADDVRLAPGLRIGLGGTISKLRLKARVTPVKSLNALLSGKRAWRKAVERWRTNSGTADIAQLDIVWGKTEANGAGLLALDKNHRPKGLIQLKIKNYGVLADEATRKHLMDGAEQTLLSGLMVEAARTGGSGAEELPVTLAFKDGLIYAGDTPAGFLEPLY